MKTSNQISSDNLTLYRVIAMTMVVLYHCTCYYASHTWPFGEGPYNSIMKVLTTLMGGIHMPVFVFISGYLYWILKHKGHYKNFLLFYKNKVLRLLVPYFVIGGGVLLIFSDLYRIQQLLYGICHLWFLQMLFGLFILSPGLWYLLETVKNDRLVTGLVTASFLIFPFFAEINFLEITKIFYFLPFFLLGYILQRRGVTETYNDWKYWLGLIGSFALLFVLCPRTLFMDKVIREYASFLVIIVITLIPNFAIPKGARLLVKNISDNSMGIYLFHQIIVACLIMTPAIKGWLDTTNCYLGVLFLFSVTFVSSWLLSIISNQYKLTQLLIGSKPQ